MNLLLASWNGLNDIVQAIQLFLSHSDDQIIRFQIVALFLTMIVCATVACVMLYMRPRFSLDWGFFIREIAFTAVLARAFIAFYFRNPPQLWSLIIYVVLFFSCIWIIIALIRERRMTNAEIAARHRREEESVVELQEGIQYDVEDR